MAGSTVLAEMLIFRFSVDFTFKQTARCGQRYSLVSFLWLLSTRLSLQTEKMQSQIGSCKSRAIVAARSVGIDSQIPINAHKCLRQAHRVQTQCITVLVRIQIRLAIHKRCYKFVNTWLSDLVWMF